MLSQATTRIFRHDFGDKLRRVRFSVVRVASGLNTLYDPGVVPYLQTHWAPQIAFYVLDRSLVGDSDFWLDHFRTKDGPYKVSGIPEDGYYLFDDSAIVAFHDGSGKARALTPREERISEALQRHPEFAPTRVSLIDRERIAQLITVLDDAIATSTGTYRQDPPPRVLPTARPEHYRTLGVRPDATDEELHAAYREAMRQNHPDRVAHLSAALQSFAEAQTRAIREAYDTIVAARRAR
jgi:DnaJ-domain-containing protein 1